MINVFAAWNWALLTPHQYADGTLHREQLGNRQPESLPRWSPVLFYGGMPRKKKHDIDWDNLNGLYRSEGAALRHRAGFCVADRGILAVPAREAETVVSLVCARTCSSVIVSCGYFPPSR